MRGEAFGLRFAALGRSHRMSRSRMHEGDFQEREVLIVGGSRGRVKRTHRPVLCATRTLTPVESLCFLFTP